MKELERSLQNEVVCDALEVKKVLLHAMEKRIEKRKESLLKSIELGTSIDPGGDPNADSDADGGMSWRAMLKETYRDISLEEKDINKQRKANYKRCVVEMSTPPPLPHAI